MSDPHILAGAERPLQSVDAISVLIERNMMTLPQLKSDLRSRPAAQRERAEGFIRRGVEIQGLYLERMLAMRMTIEFLLECRPIRSKEGWEGIGQDGVPLEPPEAVKFCLNEAQSHLDTFGRGVPL